MAANSSLSSSSSRRPPPTTGAILIEFITGLGKFIWLTLVGMISVFLPVTPKDVKKEIVLITGSGSGIGRLMAKRFASLGALVVLWDIDTHNNNAVCEEIKNEGGRAIAFTCDLSDKEDIYQTAAKVQRDVGSVTVLINNAGIVTGRKLFDLSDEMIEKTFTVNTLAHFWTIKAFVPDMISKNHGHIITIASGAGLFGIPGLVDYCSSKFGAVGTHSSLTLELKSSGCTGVHTTVVCPYFIDTGMFDGVRTKIPFVLPILKADYAVDKIMAAYHSNQVMLFMPRSIYLFYMLQGMLPVNALISAAQFFGVTRAMDTFKGPRETRKKD